MTDQTPAPSPPPPPGPPAPPAPPVPAAPAPSGSGGGQGKKVVIGVVAAAVLLGGGYGAYAVYDRLDGGGAQPHDVLPATTDAYLRLDLDPSASQKVDLFKLVRRFPDVAEEIGIKSNDQDIRELVFEQVLSSECKDIDYEDHVKPWLGDRVGIGAEIEDERFLIAVQTKDEDASRAGIKKLLACADDTYGIAYLDGYAIVAPKQVEVDAAVKATQNGTLGDDKTFVRDFEQLGDQGVVSAWVDLAEIADIRQLAENGGAQVEELKKAGSLAMTMRVDGSAIEIAALGGPDQGDTKSAASLAKLPADTVAALSVSGGGKAVGDGFEQFLQEFDSGFSGAADPVDPASPAPVAPVEPNGTPFSDDLGGLDPEELPPLAPRDGFGGFSGGGFNARGLVDDFEQSTGLQLPEDLNTLFGDNLTFAMGAENIDTIPTMSGPEGLTALDIALSLTSDPAAALDLVQRLATLAADAGVPLVASPSDDGAVLATNQDAADAITEGDGTLGDNKVFRSVIPNGDDTTGGFYLNVGAILDKLLQADPPEDIRDGLEEAKAISAVGVSVSRNGDDRPLTSLRIAFGKDGDN